MDYQGTLNLPKTDFSMKANLAQKEPAFLEKWQKENIYQEIRNTSSGKKTFILHDGPPYANGHIHIGHALNKILKDMIVKFRTMEGYDALYVPGWDCHGLPIEHQLFKDLKKHKSEVDCVDFRKKAHEFAMKFVEVQKEEFKRLGVFGQWDRPYLTLDPEYEYWILKSLSTLNTKGYVYRGLKPVNWCFNCETALAEAEVEYENHTSPSVYVKFEVENPEKIGIKGLPQDKKVYLLVWTTTPWTLMANVAVAVHHMYQYDCMDIGEECLMIENSLAQSVLTKANVSGKKIAQFKGDELTGLVYQHPFSMLEQCRVVAVDYVTKEDGTGLVHTAPGHGQEDFQTGVKYKLPVLMPVDHRGIFTKDAKQFAGEHVFKANEKIIEALEQSGSLFACNNITHSYPHCWRCKKPVIFRATKQWFLNIDHDRLRTKLKEAIDNDVQWIPPAGQERISSMVITRPDWCLSRQRYWGVPIPAVKCEKCDEHILDSEVINNFAQVVKEQGTNAWFEKELKEFLPSNFSCLYCKSKQFVKTDDILDVWFDSGVSHQAVFHTLIKAPLPADMYLEGSDQHRGWFQSSLIPSMAMDGRAPFKSVLTHGFVVDGQGRKMSKSLGNVISPQDIIKNHGADILRLWVASSNYHDDIRLSKEILDRLIDAYRKIRNTVRYILGNLYDFDPDKHQVSYSELLEIDQWALYRLAYSINDMKRNYEHYEFAKVYRQLYTFCNDELSSIYLDILKDRLYTSASNSRPRRSAQTVLYHILNYLVRLMAPVLSFTAEEAFAMMPKDKGMKNIKSVHLLPWLDVPKEWENQNLDTKFDPLIKMRTYVLKSLEEKRQNGDIGSSLEAKVIFRTASIKDFEYLTAYQNILPSTFIVSQVGLEKIDSITNGGLGHDFPKIEILIEKAQGQKCSRCWNYSSKVGSDIEHPSLCERCLPIVKELI